METLIREKDAAMDVDTQTRTASSDTVRVIYFCEFNYRRCLPRHACEPVFAKQFPDTYSEVDYQYEFLAYIFGSFLGRNQDVVLK